MRCIIFLLMIIGHVSVAEARTWEVNADGSGDVPDLYAAMDSAAAGDSVLVGPGFYSLPDRLTVHGGIRLIGRDGAAATHLEAIPSDIPTSGITLYGEMDGIHLFGVSNFLFTIDGAGTVRRCIIDGGTPVTATVFAGTLEYNVIVGERIEVYTNGALFNNNIIGAQLYSSGNVDCCFFSNDVYGVIDPNFTITTQSLNFFLDPQFCGIPGSGNFYLKSTSPCLPENNPYGVALSVGPLGIGCGAVNIKSTTWGAIKAMYQDHR